MLTLSGASTSRERTVGTQTPEKSTGNDDAP
jgi:hypothetical protein